MIYKFHLDGSESRDYNRVMKILKFRDEKLLKCEVCQKYINVWQLFKEAETLEEAMSDIRIFCDYHLEKFLSN